jgi:hypothetical protein
MSQSTKSPLNRLRLKAIIVLAVVVLAGVTSVAVLTTETSCTYHLFPGGPSVDGQQTYWEKLVGGLCHPLSG